MRRRSLRDRIRRVGSAAGRPLCSGAGVLVVAIALLAGCSGRDRVNPPEDGGESFRAEIVQPNGGESWKIGSSQTIQYTATDPGSPDENLTISLDYSTDGGSQWTSIATGLSNTGQHAWTVPSASTTSARVRVTAGNGTDTVTDMSDGNFTIFQDTGSDTLSIGSATGSSGSQVTVDVSLNNSQSVKGLQSDIQFNAGVASFSDFTGFGRGAGMQASSQVLSAGVVRILLYFDTASVLAAGQGSVARLTFNLTGAAGTNTALTPTSMVLSDPDAQQLAVTGVAGSLTVTGGQLQAQIVQPNGGESWGAGTSQAILYTATDPGSPDENLKISLDYSTDGGSQWISIAAGQANTGSYAWTVPSVSTTTARVRVTASNGTSTASDVSDGNVTIFQDTGSNTLSIGSASGPSGSQATVEVGLNNSQSVKGLQSDI